MGMISVDNLVVGMRLDEDVRDRTGRMLLGAGVDLTSKHLRILRMWGVIEVSVAGIEGDDKAAHLPEDVNPSELELAEKALATLFRNADMNHPVNRELLRLAALRRIRHGNS